MKCTSGSIFRFGLPGGSGKLRRMRSLVGPLLLAFAVTVILTGCNVNFDSVSGNGKSTTENRSVSGFTSVELDGSGELQIEQTGTESLSITADENLLQYLTSDVSGGRLRLGTKSGTNINGTVNYKLTVKNLSEIGVQGSGSVNAKGLTSDSMKIAVAGSGNITTAGTADRMEVAIEGSGHFQGDNFKSKDAKVEINGSGGATLAVSERLDATINGSGSVEYIGDPQVTVNNNGSGTVSKKH